MTSIAIRISCKKQWSDNPLSGQLLMQWLKQEKFDDYLICVEGNGTENKHLQGYLHKKSENGAPQQLQSFRKRFKKKLPHLVGNGSYSMKSKYSTLIEPKLKPVDEGQLLYVAKGDHPTYSPDHPPSIWISSYSDGEVQFFHQQWHLKKLQYEKVKADYKKAAQKKTLDFYMKVYNHIYPQNTLDGGKVHHITDKCKIINLIAQYFADNNILFTSSRFQNTFCYIFSRANPEEYKQFILYSLPMSLCPL